MTIPEFQEIADYICECEDIPYVPVKREPRMSRCYGIAQYSRKWIGGRIFLAGNCEDWSDELAVSILIHELCHIIVQDNHTPRFFEVSAQWHREFGIYEERTNKKYHGEMFYIAADGQKIPV